MYAIRNVLQKVAVEKLEEKVKRATKDIKRRRAVTLKNMNVNYELPMLLLEVAVQVHHRPVVQALHHPVHRLLQVHLRLRLPAVHRAHQNLLHLLHLRQKKPLWKLENNKSMAKKLGLLSIQNTLNAVQKTCAIVHVFAVKVVKVAKVVKKAKKEVTAKRRAVPVAKRKEEALVAKRKGLMQNNLRFIIIDVLYDLLPCKTMIKIALWYLVHDVVKCFSVWQVFFLYAKLKNKLKIIIHVELEKCIKITTNKFILNIISRLTSGSVCIFYIHAIVMK